MFRHKIGVILVIVGLLSVTAAVGLFGYNMWEDEKAGASVEKVMEAIDELDNESSGRETDENVIPDYILNPDMDMPEVEIDGNTYIGTITIPVLDLELPIQGEWSYPRLKTSPCRYKGSVYLGNMVIAAHNYNSHFGRIKNLRPGDEVLFTDMDGNEFKYTVSQVETLQSTAIEEMEAGEWELTLFTCTIGGKSRVTVRCSEVKEELIEFNHNS